MNNWISFQFSTKQSSSRGFTPNRLPEIGSFGFNDNENNFCHKELASFSLCVLSTLFLVINFLYDFLTVFRVMSH